MLEQIANPIEQHSMRHQLTELVQAGLMHRQHIELRQHDEEQDHQDPKHTDADHDCVLSLQHP